MTSRALTLLAPLLLASPLAGGEGESGVEPPHSTLLRGALSALFLVLVTSLAAQPSADKSGVKPNVLSLPSGPGSIEGLGESFEPQLNSGTGSYRVPLSLPPGRAGFGPALALAYSTGGGNSDFGIGWSLGVSSIQRQTDKGIPGYGAGDVFLLDGEELAELSDGTFRVENEGRFARVSRIEGGAGWLVEDRDGTRHFLGESPGGRVRSGVADAFDQTFSWHLQRSVDVHGNAIHYGWRAFEDSPGRLYLETVRYNQGPGSFYEVTFEYGSGSPGERTAWDGAMARLQQATGVPAEAFEFPTSAALRHYEPLNTGLPLPKEWDGFHPLGTAQTRPDALSDFRGGFHQRLGRRCSQVVVRRGSDQIIRRYDLRYADESGEPSAGNALSLLASVTVFGKGGAENTYLPPLRFDYTRLAGAGDQPTRRVFNAPPVALANANVDLVDLNADGLPDIVQIEPGDNRYWLNLGRDVEGSVRYSDARALVNVPGGLRLEDPALQFADLDGDSAVDLVHYRGPGDDNIAILGSPGREADYSDARAFASFGAARNYLTAAPFVLGDPNVQFLDFNFDKFIDVVVSDPFGLTYYENNGGRTWTDLGSTDFGSAAMANVPAGTTFATPGVQLTDMNGDRLQDIVRVMVDNARIEVTFWHSRGNRRWDMGRVMVGSTFGLSDRVEDVRLMDVNGDGLADLVAMGSGTPHSDLRYWINKGDGRWSAAVSFTQTDGRIPAYTADTAIRVADMNGNGMADLVYANGTRIEYVDFAGDGPKPNMLARVDNGIGRRVSMEYRSSTDHAADAATRGEPWQERLPMAVPVVTAIETRFGPFDLNGDGEHDVYRTSIRYRDGVYDSFEKEFRGFRFAEKFEWGDDYALAWHAPWLVMPTLPAEPAARVGTARSVTLISRFRFHTGTADGEDNDDYQGPAGGGATDERTAEGGNEEEALKGKPVWEEKVDGAALRDTVPGPDGAPVPALRGGQHAADAYVYTRTETDWRIRRLHRIMGDTLKPDPAFGVRTVNGRAVSYPVQLATRTTEFAANGYLGQQLGHPLRDPVTTMVEMDYDKYGNPILEANWGIVERGDAAQSQLPDDERITRRRFIGSDLDYALRTDWMLDRVFEEIVEDEDASFVSRTNTYYDGPDFVGLAHGLKDARGLVSRVEQFINGTTPPASNEGATGEVGDARLTANASINASRTAYDLHGNAVAMLDPLGNLAHVSSSSDAGRPVYTSTSGHLRSILYDTEFFTYPVRESVVLEAPKPTLTMSAAYDTTLGVMTSSTDFSGNESTYGYDAYGRLTSIVKPGSDPVTGLQVDTAERPTQRFSYTAADPWTGTLFAYDREGRIQNFPPAGGGTLPLVNAVRSFLREDFTNGDGENTLDSVKYTDGLGRALLEAAEGETADERLDGIATGPAVGAAKTFNLRAGEFATQLPYFGTGELTQWLPIPANMEASRSEVYPDALGRPVRVVMPPESPGGPRLFTLTHHLPRETHSYDEEQSRPGSPRHGARIEHVKDGLDRLIEVREVVRITDAGEPYAAPTPPAQWVTRYEYDLQDNLVYIRDSLGNTKWMRHDGLGRKVFMNDPDRGVMVYTYDVASNLVLSLDAKGQKIAYAYDGANRLVSEDYLDDGQPDVVYHYDAWTTGIEPGDGTATLLLPTNAKGMLVAVEDLTGAEYFSYDQRSRVVWRTKAVDDPHGGPPSHHTFRFRYDAMDRLRDIVYPDNDAVRYEYNRRGEIERIVGGLTGEAAGRVILDAHDSIPSGQKQHAVLGNGILTSRTYDPRLRMQHLMHRGGYSPGTGADGWLFTDYAYTFDGASNITRIADQRPTSGPAWSVAADSPRRNTQDFAYDDLYRLVTVEYPRAGDNDRIDFRYDPIGNMLSKVVPATGPGHWTLEEKGKSLIHMGAMTYGQAAPGQSGPTGTANRAGRTANGAAGPHALTATASGRTFEYDANGNMSRIEDDEATWDAKDRLHALRNTARQADYRYDYADRRISKHVRNLRPDGTVNDDLPSTTTLYVDRLFELREGDNPTKYVYHGSERIARVAGTLAPGRHRVQRLRLSPGFNLATPIVIPPGGATAQSIFGLGANPAVIAVFRFNAVTLLHEGLAPASPVVPGEGYWIATSAAVVRTIRGVYTDMNSAPPSLPLPPGPALVGWPRLEPFFPARDATNIAMMFAFHAPGQRYAPILAGGVPAWVNVPPLSLPPGAAFYTRSDGAAALQTATPAQRAHDILFLLPDHLGTHQTVTDATGTLVSETASLPYGKTRVKYEQVKLGMAIGYRFTEKEEDDESGLMYFEARYLHAATGVFIAVDPTVENIDIDTKSEQQMNPNRILPYRYCSNSPIMRVDPTGMVDLEMMGTGGLLLAGAALALTAPFSMPLMVAVAASSGLVLGTYSLGVGIFTDKGSVRNQQLRDSIEFIGRISDPVSIAGGLGWGLLNRRNGSFSDNYKKGADTLSLLNGARSVSKGVAAMEEAAFKSTEVIQFASDTIGFAKSISDLPQLPESDARSPFTLEFDEQGNSEMDFGSNVQMQNDNSHEIAPGLY